MTTLIQISDPHITERDRLAYGRVDTHAALRRAVAHVNALPARLGPLDAVIFSGDLTDLGSESEYRAFRALIAPLDAPVFVLPGNHDQRGALRRAFADVDYLPTGHGPLDFALTLGDLRVVALDTTVPGAPHGWLEPTQLQWIERTLAPAPETPTLVFMHHPPFDTGIGHMDAQRLRNGDALIALLRRHRQVRLAAAGHVHRPVSTMIDGLPLMIAPAPAHAVALDLSEKGPAHYQLEPGAVTAHCRRDGRLISHLSYVDAYEGPYPFYSDTGDLIL